MITHTTEIKLFTGNSNKPLAEGIAKALKMPLGDAEVGTFSDGEISVHIGETVRGRDVFIIQSTSQPVNDNLMELLVMIDAARRASAEELRRLCRISATPVRTEKQNRATPSPQNSLQTLFRRRVRTGF